MPVTVEQATKELRRRDAMRELESRGVSVEPDPGLSSDEGYSYDEPVEYEKQLKETLDIADELELGITETEVNYKNLTEKPDRKPMAVIPTGYTGIRAAPDPTAWEKFKNFFKDADRPLLPPDADRTDKAARALDIALSGPLRAFMKFSKGMTLGAPDLMWAALKRITPDDMWEDEVKGMTLDEAMDWAGGYDPSGFQKVVGELAEFGGRLRTVAPIAQKIGVIGNTPKDLTVLDKAFETAKLFGAAAIGEQASKFAATKIDPTEAEYGFEGPKAVLRDMAIGAAFSLVHSGVKGAWSKITPSEEARVLKVLGLKKGASLDEIEAAAKELHKQYQPGTIETLRNEFGRAIKERVKFVREGDITFRGQKVEFKPKLLPGETVKQQAIRLAEKPPAPKGVTKVSSERQAQLDAIKAEGRTKQSIRAEEFKTKEQIAEEEAQAARHLASIAQESKIEAKPTTTAPAKDIVAPGETVYYRGDTGAGVLKEGKRTKGLIALTKDKHVAADYVAGGIPDTEEGFYEYEQSGQLERDLAKVDEYKVVAKNTLEIDEEGLKIISGLKDKGNKEARKIIGDKELLYWWTHTQEHTQDAWEKILIPQLQELGYDSIEYQDDVNTGRTLAVFSVDQLSPAVPPKGQAVEGGVDVLSEWSRLNREIDNTLKEMQEVSGTERETLRNKLSSLHADRDALDFGHAVRKMTPEEIAEDKEFHAITQDILNAGPDKVNAALDILEERIDLLGKVAEGVITQEEADVITQKFVQAAKLRIPEPQRKQVQSREVSPTPQAKAKAKKPEVKKATPSPVVTPAKGSKKPEVEKQKIPATPPKGQAGKAETRLMFGLDPGIDKFVAESLKPAAITAAKGVKALAKFTAGVPKFAAKAFLQPSLELEQKSPEAYVSVMKAVHTARDAAKLDFKTMPVEAMDMNIEQVRSYFDKFTKEQQYDFMVSFGGQPGTPDAALMQKEAFDRLPEELQDPKVLKAVREIADKNFQYLVDVVGPNVGLVPDYFYGVFKSRKSVDKFWEHWTSTDKFTKKKTVPSVADAINYGLESGTDIRPRYDNYVDNLMAEYLGIARLDAMQQLKAELLKTGSAGTKKPPAKVDEKGKRGKKKGTLIERRAAKLTEIYGSAKEALRLQELQYKMSGAKVLTQQEEATIAALNKLIAEERSAGNVMEIPAGDESLDKLREKSEAQEPDVKVIHPEDADFYITEDPEIAPPDWGGVADPVFRGAWLRPDLARLINNLTATNKITQHGILNPVRQANNITRSMTFFGSAFHLKTVTLAGIADSGWGGPLLHPMRALKPFRQWPSTKQWKKVQQTPEYKRLLRLGVGLGYSAEEEAFATMKQFDDFLRSNNLIGATGKLIEGLALRLPLAFQKWQFDTYIPMLKHIANMDEWALLEARTGREATDAELIDIIKGTQNLYGEMNERLLGRSATQTTGSRFFAKAPGFAEGNVRTNIDAGTKFAGERGYTRGRRARAQIVNSLLVKRVLAVAGTIWLTGKWPKKVEKKEDFADLFKIDTGQVDGRDRRIMINTLDSDKDYLDLWFNMFVVRPDRALYKAFNRLGGMKSTLAEFVYDGVTSIMRQDIRNWKGEKVFNLSDTPTEKLWKYTALALDRLEPISADVFQQMRRKEIGRVQAFLGAIAGVRPTFSEYDIRESEFLRLIYDQEANLEVLDIEILSKKNPREAYESYNKKVDQILNSKYLPEGFKELYGPELYRDVDEYLQNKAETASHWATNAEDKKTTDHLK